MEFANFLGLEGENRLRKRVNAKNGYLKSKSDRREKLAMVSLFYSLFFACKKQKPVGLRFSALA